MHAAEPFPHFVDDFLTYLYEAHPTSATMDGVHLHDDLLEDFRKPAIDTHLSALAGFARRLDAIPVDNLPDTERVEHAIVSSNIRSRVFEYEQVRSWERNPYTYAEVLASSLAAQTIFDYASEPDRARRVLSKLRQTPRLIEAARENIKEPPAMFVKVGVETLRGVMTFIDSDLPKAFSTIDDLHLLADLADASTEAVQSIGVLRRLPRKRGPPARESFVPARKREIRTEAARRRRDCPTGRTIARDCRTRVACHTGRVPYARRTAQWRRPNRILAQSEAGIASGAWATALDRARTDRGAQDISRTQLRDLDAGGCNGRRPAHARFFPLVVCQHVDAWPLEPRASRAVYYLTDADPTWSDERKREHLRDFNIPTLWNISIHEVFPGHYLHYQHLRRVESKVRRSTLFMTTSYVEGWAHYCEQMMIEAGFGRRDHALKLGQLAEALVRLARFVVGIRLHTEDWSVEQGVRFFRDEAFLEDASARREAERGTFDPTYLVYTAGKLALLKLRRDWQEQHGGKPSLRAFHDALMAQGAAPFWALRQLMLGGPALTQSSPDGLSARPADAVLE